MCTPFFEPRHTATEHFVWVQDTSGVRIQSVYTAAQAGCPSYPGSCSVTPYVVLTPGAATWWVQARNQTGNGPWSADGVFSVALATPTLVSPVNQGASSVPTYTWNAILGTAMYFLWVDDSTGTRITSLYTPAQANCASGTGTCSVTPYVPLNGVRWLMRRSSHSDCGGCIAPCRRLPHSHT